MECKRRGKAKVIYSLNDEEVRMKMKYFENLISELEWRRNRYEKPNLDDEAIRVHRETRNEIKRIAASYARKEQLVIKDTQMFESRMAGAARLQILQEKDKNVIDVVLGVHHRLGRIDHFAHKKAYRRILYALLVQGLCRLLEREVVLIFRKSDLKLGNTVIGRAQQKYKEITGMDIHITTSSSHFLPVESCGGVEIHSSNDRHILNNSLATRLDQLLHKACPMIRIALYGLNKGRTFFDLSKMSGSPTLFDFPFKVQSSDEQDNTSREEKTGSNHDQRVNYDNFGMISPTNTNAYNVMTTELTVS